MLLVFLNVAVAATHLQEQKVTYLIKLKKDVEVAQYQTFHLNSQQFFRNTKNLYQGLDFFSPFQPMISEGADLTVDIKKITRRKNWIKLNIQRTNAQEDMEWKKQVKIALQDLLEQNESVLHVQPNFIYSLSNLHFKEDLTISKKERKKFWYERKNDPDDNPDFVEPTEPASNAKDPYTNEQWALDIIRAEKAWDLFAQSSKQKEIVVAVLDTGVDYTHPDLVNKIYRNPGEMGLDAKGNDKSTNGLDDDKNGFIDDVSGWDFTDNDNKPYDLHKKAFTKDFGHGTHVAGVLGASINNGEGIAGVAPNVKIMPLSCFEWFSSRTYRQNCGSH